MVPSKKVIPATVEFVDIAGLVSGASRGEGLGNQFLAAIRETGVVIHVVRCFDDPDVAHVADRIDPIADIETINIELALADLETVEKRIQRTEKALRVASKDQQKEASVIMPILERLRAALGDGKPARSCGFDANVRELLRDLFLITLKPLVYVCNVDEKGLSGNDERVRAVRCIAEAEGTEALPVCAKVEAEIAALESPEERREFLAAAGIGESGLSAVIHAGYRLLGLRTFFTVGEQEDRAWTFHEGDTAPDAAGVIHTDFRKGFIKAEVFHFDDLVAYGSEQKVKAAGKLRLEGKEYVVKDGDIMHFRFNV
jgi:hypothetical protein